MAAIAGGITGGTMPMAGPTPTPAGGTGTAAARAPAPPGPMPHPASAGMAAAIQAGTVWVNTWAEQDNKALPFGGYKQSGTGREGGLEVLDAYTQSKAVLIAL